MKKALFSMCVFASIFVSQINAPLFATVESTIVGYTTIKMEAGKWYQVGFPFVYLNDEEPRINDVFIAGFEDGDSLNIFDPNDVMYTPYYWKSAIGGWCTKRGSTLVDTTIGVGKAVFIHKAVSRDVPMSGRYEAREVEYGSASGNSWSQIVCLYPEAVKLNDMSWKGVEDGDKVNILTYDRDENGNLIGEPYYNLYYWKSANGGWCTKRGTRLVDVTIEPGQALFMYRQNPGTASVSVELTSSK